MSAITWTSARAKVAALSRARASDDPELLQARSQMRAARAEDYIHKLISEAPPLTGEQRDRLAVILLAPDVNVGAA